MQHQIYKLRTPLNGETAPYLACWPAHCSLRSLAPIDISMSQREKEQGGLREVSSHAKAIVRQWAMTACCVLQKTVLRFDSPFEVDKVDSIDFDDYFAARVLPQYGWGWPYY